jgi:hypothetical protein
LPTLKGGHALPADKVGWFLVAILERESTRAASTTVIERHIPYSRYAKSAAFAVQIARRLKSVR